MDGTQLAEEVRGRILAAPELILEDADVMRALVAARDRTRGPNVVDLRGLAMERLESRLERLEDTHRYALAAAYENLSGTQMVQRAVLRLMEPDDFAGFLDLLGGEVAGMLRLDRIRLVLESTSAGDTPAAGRFGEVLRMAPPGFTESYVQGPRRGPMRAVTLRHVPAGAEPLYGPEAADLGSEALMRLDIGRGRLPALLALATRDPQHFHPSHGTDLLAFLAGAVERLLQRWLG